MTRKTKTVLWRSIYDRSHFYGGLMLFKGIVPFGSKGIMAIMDAQIQYLDFLHI